MSGGQTEAMRLAQIVRAKDPMEGLCKERLISPEACDWVKYSLDPFHDLQLDNLKAYPDVSTEPSVVVKIRQAITVSSPFEATSNENWDCHIVLSPIDFARARINDAGADDGSTIRPAGVYPQGNNATGAASTPAGYIRTDVGTDKDVNLCGRMDGLLINSVPNKSADDANLTYTPGHCPQDPDTVNGHQLQGLHLDKYLDFDATDLGVYRLVYSGFEVVNTTAQIYKQGACTVYEYGNSFEPASTNTNTLTSASPPYAGWDPGVQTTMFRQPPNNLAEAKIMPGSHSWAAQDGCYNTAKFQTDNPFQAVTNRNFALCQNQTSAGSKGGYYGDSGGAFENTLGSFISSRAVSRSGGTASGEQEAVPAVHYSRMNTTGAYFTGLSPQTTLFITWRVGLERLPAANKPMFLALAQPSASYDPNALVLYSLVASALPPGVPQGYNDAGRWFRAIADVAKAAIPKVYPLVRMASTMATSLGRPIIGGALNQLSGMLKGPAEAAAKATLAKAVNNMRARNNPQRSANGNGKPKQAIQNWKKPYGKSGGTNGLS